jgi:hypothetical protein
MVAFRWRGRKSTFGQLEPGRREIVKTASIITVGSTADPIHKAVEEAREDRGEAIVFLLYGCALFGQK